MSVPIAMSAMVEGAAHVAPPPVSVMQVALQPSPAIEFPSSQVSLPSTVPLPHVPLSV
jgi:hypothetical protein